jgi:D-sedoheptulose 7-phosphate isomerase
MNARIQEISGRISESITVKQLIMNDNRLLSEIESVIQKLYTVLSGGNRVLFCGNGGSAADAQHLAAELSGKFYFDRPALPAEACHVNTSFMTAVSNDYGFRRAFARYIEGFGNQGDMLIALSTSGNSENIMEAIRAAREKKMTVVGFTGASGGMMKEACDYLINIPSADTPRIQEAHITIGHIICETVEKMLFR